MHTQVKCLSFNCVNLVSGTEGIGKNEVNDSADEEDPVHSQNFLFVVLVRYDCVLHDLNANVDYLLAVFIIHGWLVTAGGVGEDALEFSQTEYAFVVEGVEGQ